MYGNAYPRWEADCASATGARIDGPMQFAPDKKSGRQTPDGSSGGNSSNGAQPAQTAASGADGRDSTGATPITEIGSNSNTIEMINVTALAPNEYERWDGTVGVVRVGSVVPDPANGLRFVENKKPSAVQLEVAANIAAALGDAHAILRQHGSQDEKDGALIDVFISNRSTADRQMGAKPKPGDVAIAWQAFNSKNAAPVFQMLEISRDVYRSASLDTRLFVALHELMHFRKSTSNYSQIRTDAGSAVNNPSSSILAPSEIDASKRAMSLLKSSGWDLKRATKLPNDLYGKAHMNEVRSAVWSK